MSAEAILAAIALAARWAQLLAQIGGDAGPIIAMIASWSSKTTQPTAEDFVALAALVKPSLDKLNDTSKDIPA